MRYIIFILIFFYPISIFASSKELIKNKLNETDNISFKFIQKIGKKTEKGECIISYPKKILCKYDDIYNKILVSNGKSLVINSQKITNYLRYQLRDTPLDLILDKKFLLNKLDNIEIIQENDETYDVITTLESFHNVMVYLEDKYSFPKLSAIEWRPINTIDVNDEENAKKLFTLLDKLEDLDDVQTVASNFNIDEELLKKVIQ